VASGTTECRPDVAILDAMTSDVSAEWVALSPRFTPGWPWPEDSFGMDPMFGAEGWCHECGTPLRDQTGPLTIQASKFPTAKAWMPNWMFDVVCLASDLAKEVQTQFPVQLRDVHKPREGATGVKQLQVEATNERWYDTQELERAIRNRHRHGGERTGLRCSACNTWKWLPISEADVATRAEALATDQAIIASPEIFGDGSSSFRHLLFREPLAQTLKTASPRLWDVTSIRVS